MTRVIITGAGSYIGTHLHAWLSRQPERFEVEEMSLHGAWDASAFLGYSCVIHVAGLAHRREQPGDEALYDRVNHELAVEVAKAAKAQGVRQFIFFSSMSVYGLTCGRITEHTQPAPNTHYGVSKWKAERALGELEDASFHVAVLRPPMIYGRGCRGNYPRLSALAQSLPLFPRVQNERSMLYIDTLCAFVQRLVESGAGGLYFPQNREYVSTCGMVCEIAACHGRRVRLVPGMNTLLGALAPRMGLVGKVFGTLTYDQRMSDAFRPEEELSFAQTIRQTEVGT
ncbi:MAG: NAD-dependent epimerase/dehydratase family protein [Candidatus Limiplasma sp.]|nr:NAD-dependent epimerase/dehydratase family protein [Candidatus Limiplasma sp.]